MKKERKWSSSSRPFFNESTFYEWKASVVRRRTERVTNLVFLYLSSKERNKKGIKWLLVRENIEEISSILEDGIVKDCKVNPTMTLYPKIYL